MTDAKIRIKIGSIEIDFEGTESFIKSDLLRTLEQIKETFKITGVQQLVSTDSGTPQPDSSVSRITSNLSVAVIASKLNVKSCTDLVTAAAARLTLVEGLTEFSRKQISDTMKDARNKFRESFMKNLTRALNKLSDDGVLNPLGNERYSLTEESLKELKGRLAS